MFMDELSPLFQELLAKPVAFMGGFASGLLRLNLADDPVKGWLDQEMEGVDPNAPPTVYDSQKNGGGPQSITIE